MLQAARTKLEGVITSLDTKWTAKKNELKQTRKRRAKAQTDRKEQAEDAAVVREEMEAEQDAIIEDLVLEQEEEKASLLKKLADMDRRHQKLLKKASQAKAGAMDKFDLEAQEVEEFLASVEETVIENESKLAAQCAYLDKTIQELKIQKNQGDFSAVDSEYDFTVVESISGSPPRRTSTSDGMSLGEAEDIVGFKQADMLAAIMTFLYKNACDNADVIARWDYVKKNHPGIYRQLEYHSFHTKNHGKNECASTCDSLLIWGCHLKKKMVQVILLMSFGNICVLLLNPIFPNMLAPLLFTGFGVSGTKCPSDTLAS